MKRIDHSFHVAAWTVVAMLGTPTVHGFSCLQTDSPPAPPDHGVVLWFPGHPNSTVPNTLMLEFGETATVPGIDDCYELVGSLTVLTVAPGAALSVLGNKGRALPWGAVNVGPPDRPPDFQYGVGPPDWEFQGFSVKDPVELLETTSTCPRCEFSGRQIALPGTIEPSDFLAYKPGNLAGANLKGAVISGDGGSYSFDGSDLSGASLKGVHLDYAHFAGTKVDGTLFDGATLSNATFDTLQFQKPPSFSGVTLGGFLNCTSFANTDLVNVDFTGVQWSAANGCENALFPGSRVPLYLLARILVPGKASGANLAGTQVVASGHDRKTLADADLTGVKLAGVNFLGEAVDFTGTHFDGANLTGANLALSHLSGATLANVSAAGASFKDADLTGQPAANFSGPQTNLQTADFVNADISGAQFIGADLTLAVFDGARGNGTSFNGVTGRNTSFRGTHITGDGEAFDNATDLRGADFSGAVLAGMGINGFDFTGAPLGDASSDSAAKFDSAVCPACNFTGAKLSQVNFGGAYLPGSIFSNALLTRANLNQAWLYCGDAKNSQCDQDLDNQGYWDWELRLGSGEQQNQFVPFGPTNFTGASLADVTACPDGTPGGVLPVGCPGGRLLPNPNTAPPIPAPCSASAHGGCPTPTVSVWDTSAIGTPLAIAALPPPTWNTLLSSNANYVALDDGTIRSVGEGSPTVVAGVPGKVCRSPSDSCGDGGPASAALLGKPSGLAVGLDGALYIADPTLQRVRRVDPATQIITTVVGCVGGPPRTDCTNGPNGIASAFAPVAPSGVWIDPRGVLYFADGVAGIRRVATDGTLTTLAWEQFSPCLTLGIGTSFQSVVGDADGILYAATRNPDYLLRIDPASGACTVAVGTGTFGYNGTTDSNDNLLPGNQVQINRPTGLAVNLEGNVVFADSGNHLIRTYVPSSGHVKTHQAGVVTHGQPQGGFNGDEHWATETQLNNPLGVAATRGSLMVVADSGNKRIRLLGGPTPSTMLGAPKPQPNLLLTCRPGRTWVCRRQPLRARVAKLRRHGAVMIHQAHTVFGSGWRLRSPGLKLLLNTQRHLAPGEYHLIDAKAVGQRVRNLRVR
jgi:uncharacterized protein YjbI with pentapeptide repeats